MKPTNKNQQSIKAKKLLSICKPEITELWTEQQEDHFLSERSTENTRRKTVWRCTEYNPCRRTDCAGCMERRRRYFVFMGVRHALNLDLNKHATITWPLHPGESAWERLLSLSEMIPKRLTGRIGPFMRVLAIGRHEAPHVHYLIRSDFEQTFETLAKNHSPSGSRIFIDIEAIHDLEGLLNYLFTKNFGPTVNDPRKIKGMRIISGSRGGLTYSYPKKEHWMRYERLLAESFQ